MKKLILMTILIVLIAGCTSSDPYHKSFAGLNLEFRANLDEAENVTVYPNETILKNILLSDDVKEIGIAYIPNDTENSFYYADSYELAYKLTIINRYYFNKTKIIDSLPLNFSSNAFDKASSQRPVILLLGQSQTNITSIEVYPTSYVIILKGKSFQEAELNRTYTDLDLATDKLLLVLMKESST